MERFCLLSLGGEEIPKRNAGAETGRRRKKSQPSEPGVFRFRALNGFTTEVRETGGETFVGCRGGFQRLSLARKLLQIDSVLVSFVGHIPSDRSFSAIDVNLAAENKRRYRSHSVFLTKGNQESLLGTRPGPKVLLND
jgi:hypothetical protein